MQSQIGLGKPFKCRNCGRDLIIAKNFWIPLIGLLAFFRFSSYADSWQEMALVVVSIAVFMLILPKFFMPARIYKEIGRD